MEPADYQPLPQEAHDFIEGRLGADAERDFRRRLERDENLRKQVERVRATVALLRGLPVKQPGEGFADRVLGRIRDGELVERARKRITAARTPLWQHIAQVGAGAVAAALVLAVVGVPGMFGGPVEEPATPAVATVELAAVEAGEEDLLPVLGDQYERYRRLTQQVAFVPVENADTQRELLRMELELSDLVRRNRWLSGEITSLPAERRREYRRFLDDLDNALTALDRELTDSAAESRPARTEAMGKALAEVSVPARLREECRYTIVRSGTGPSGELGRSRVAAGAGDAEVKAYCAIREALYNHDLERVVAAAQAYRASFSRGRFVKPAALQSTAALLRLGRPSEAAQAYEAAFPRYDEELSGADAALVHSLLAADELEALRRARVVLHADSNE